MALKCFWEPNRYVTGKRVRMMKKGLLYMSLLLLMLTGCTKNERTAGYESLTGEVFGEAAITEAAAEVTAEISNETGITLPERTIAARRDAEGKPYYGVIDGQGNIIVPFQYETIQRRQEGYSAGKKQQQDYQMVALDFNGNPADFDPMDTDLDYLLIGQGDLYYKFSEDFINITIYRTVDDQEMLHFSSEGDFSALEVSDTSGNRRLFVQVDEGNGAYFTLFDLDLLLAGTLEQADAALLARHDGIARLYPTREEVKTTDCLVYSVYNENGGGYGLVDLDGNLITEPVYQYLDNGIFSDRYEHDMIAAKDASGLCGYIDKDGNVQIPFQYKDTKPFYKGYATVKMKDGTGAVIDKTGAQISRIENPGLDFYFGYSDYVVTEDGWTAVKYDGTIVDLRTAFDEKPAGDAAYAFNVGYGRVFMAVERYWPETKQWQYGLFNPDSSEWLIPFSGSDTMSYISIDTDASYMEYNVSEDEDGEDELKTLYNMDGKAMISGYNQLVTTEDGLFLIETGELWAWYDSQGNKLFEFERPEL